MDHTYAKCTIQRCDDCGGFGEHNGGVCQRCGGQGQHGCGGCRGAGLDCLYDSLAVCKVCRGIEGSLLPWCPGRELTFDEQQHIYEQYCQGVGPFAKATPRTVLPALEKARAYYMEDVGSMPPERTGARRFWEAMEDLYRFVVMTQGGE